MIEKKTKDTDKIKVVKVKQVNKTPKNYGKTLNKRKW